VTDLARCFSQAAQREGERVALITSHEQVSFAEVERRAAAFAATCSARGLRKGDRVIVAMKIGIELYVALAACWRLGAVAVFPEPALGLKGLRHAIKVTRPKFLFAAGSYRLIRLLPQLWSRPCLTPAHRENGSLDPVPLRPEDLALISFTSGSTGTPKAIPRSHGFLLAQYEAVRKLLASDQTETDLVAFPVFALVNLADGRTTALPNWRVSRPDQVQPGQLASWISRTCATRVLLPPSLCSTLAKGDIPESMHCVFTGGGPVKPALVDQLHARKNQLRIVSVYGSTEAEPIADLDWAEVTTEDRAAMTHGEGLLVGFPVPGTDLRIEKDEIWVAGAHVNAHYLDPRMETGSKVHDGTRVWHRTGDAGRIDEEGRLWLLGRHSGVVSGSRGPLYPFAVELAAENWPGVRRAALVNLRGQSALVIEGNISTEFCVQNARELGIDIVRNVSAIPLDPRHRSKIDYAELKRILSH
jgi:olefin beta-lactone synthetase